MKKAIVILMLILSIGGVSAFIQTTSDDAEVLEDTPGTSFGTLNETLVMLRTSHNDESYWAFDLSNFTTTTTYAEFNYFVFDTLNLLAGKTIDFYYCNDAGFDETTLTWNSRGADVTNCNTTSPLQSSPLDAFSRQRRFSFDITTRVNSEISSGDKKFVIWAKFTTNTETTTRGIRTCSKECASQYRPYVNYTLAFSMNNSYPISNLHYSYYNGSIIINGASIMSCRVNDTNWTKVGTGNSTQWHFKNSKVPIGENYYKVRVYCNKTGTTNTYNKTVEWVVDRTLPSITFLSPINNSYYGRNFTLSIRYYDVYLYRTNTTIRRTDNVTKVVFRRYNLSVGTNQQWHNLSKVIAISNASYTNGNYTIFMTGADTHTIEDFKESPIPEIESLIVLKTDSRIEIIGGKPQLIEKEVPVEINRMTLPMKYGDITFDYPRDMTIGTEKLKDRIIFDYSSKEAMQSYFEVKADKIVYMFESPYKNHLIINDKYWFDTEGLDATLEEIDGGFRVNFALGEGVVKSESLGGLNERNLTAYFVVDKTLPTLVKNSTTVIGWSAWVRMNASEKVKYNLTLMRNNCTGTIISTKSNTTMQNFTIFRLSGGMIGSTRYVAKTQITDTANNSRTYCINFTTGANELYIYNSSFINALTVGELWFRIRGIDSQEHPFIFNWTLWHNGIIDQSYVRDYLNITASVREYAVNNNGTYQSNNMYSSYYGCLNMINDGVLFRVRADNLGNYSVNASCLAYDGWHEISSDKNVYQLNENRLSFTLDNGTTVLTVTPSNYSYVGHWTNITRAFDSNLTSFAYCQSGFEDCYLYMTYPTYVQKLYYSNITYQLVNITNVTTGTYSIIINMFDGVRASPTSNITLNITFTVNIFDEITGLYINGTNMTSYIEFISDDPLITEYKTFNTTSGKFSITGLNFLDYNIYYYATGYTKRHYYLATEDLVINGSFNLFLLNSSIGEFSIIQVIDQNLLPLEKVQVKIYKYVPNFAEKQVISILRTNFEGEATLDFKKYTDEYQFVVIENGKIIKVSTPTQVSKDIVQIQVQLIEDYLQSLIIMTNATGYATIYNSTDPAYNRTCAFAWSGDNIRYGCAKVRERNLAQNDIDLCLSCANGTSGVASCDFRIRSGSIYYCDGIIDTNTTSSEGTIAQAILEFKTDLNPFGLMGLLITWFIFLVMSLLFKETPSLSILAGTIALIVSALASFISIPMSGLMIICCIAGFFIMKLRG